MALSRVGVPKLILAARPAHARLIPAEEHHFRDGCKDALSERGTYLPLNSGLREIAQAILTSRSAGKKVKHAVSENTREGLEAIVSLIEAGALKPVVDRVFSMEQIADAHRLVEGRHKRGSVIVTTAGLRRDGSPS